MDIRKKYTKWVVKKGSPWYTKPLNYFLLSPSVYAAEIMLHMCEEAKQLNDTLKKLHDTEENMTSGLLIPNFLREKACLEPIENKGYGKEIQSVYIDEIHCMKKLNGTRNKEQKGGAEQWKD